MRPSMGLLLAGSLATLVTLLIAWPVFFNPARSIYGREIIGRYPGTYAAISQFGGALTNAIDTQPLTNIPGRLLGRVLPPVVAFNVLILLTFPLSAMTAYALARYLTLSHRAGLISGLAFAFAPAHLVHAAYHPYVAQTQWIPLYFLALVALVDRRSIGRVAGVAAAWTGLVLSNNDAGFIGAVMSPAILVAFWAIRPDADRNLRPLLWPALVLAAVATTGAAFVWTERPDVFAAVARASVAIDDVPFYRARWWAYLTPAVDHQLLGGLARQIFGSRGINLQLIEEQLFVGFAMLALTAAALAMAGRRWFSDPHWRLVAAVVAVGLAAFVVSLGPTSGSCEAASLAPGCLMFRVAPWFPVYARFGIVVQLMVALAAGAGAALLGQSRAGRTAAAALLVVAAFEYWPMPARAHDVLPTEAHRFIASTPSAGHTLDCYPGSATETTIPWMMRREVSFLDAAITTCGDPQLGAKLAGLGYTQILVRRSPAASKLPAPLPVGIILAKAFPDSDIYTVATTPPRLLTLSAQGFFGYERQGDDWWRWMGPEGQWIVRNTTSMPQRVSLAVDLVSVGMPRRLTLTLDGAPVGTLLIGLSRQPYAVGPWTLSPGSHTLAFVADGDPIRPSDVDATKDNRPLTIAFRNDRWVDAP